MAQIKTSKHFAAKKVTSLYYCEKSHQLFVGSQDGEVEAYRASTGKAATASKTSLGCEEILIELD